MTGRAGKPDQTPEAAAAAAAAAQVARVVAIVRELVPAGPTVAPEAAGALRENLKNAAATAPDLVLRVMDLPADAESATRGRLVGEALVVDRPGWAKVNAESFVAIGSAIEAASGSVAGQAGRALAGTDGGLLAGVSAAETAGALAVLAPRVLGQFEPFGPTPRLVLVAPTILAVEQRLDVVPRDFRLWVALHEATHRIQFASAPWLRDHLLERLVGVTGAAVDDHLTVADLVRNVLRVVRHGGSLLDIVSTPAQLAQLDGITAVMSLLEGHADVVMDAVGPRVIPTVGTIRSRFDARRGESGGVRGALGRVLGMSEKLRQYSRGADFVRGVTSRVGHAGLAAVWESPTHLPRPAELDDPAAWVRRVLG